MHNKETALHQIDDIYKILQNNLKILISGPLMIAVGFAIVGIPLAEFVFEKVLDPFLNAIPYASSLKFLLRTIIYFATFNKIGSFFNLRRPKRNPLLGKVFKGIGKPFPYIVLSTAVVLAQTGYGELIAPIVLILIGIQFLFFGQFSDKIVRVIAYNLMLAGLVGIWLSTFSIPNLWMYLVIYQGLSFVVMGMILNQSDKQDHIE